MNGTVSESLPKTPTPLAQAPSIHRVATAGAVWTPTFVLDIDEMKRRAVLKQQFFEQVMIRDIHYGSLGKNAKPTLLKPGAELLLSAMGLYPEFEDGEAPTRRYDLEADALILYRRDCLVYRQTGDTRILVTRAQGTCSSRETQYRYREANRLCPVCKANAIIRGKEEYGGGWVCWKKRGGCDAKFLVTDTSIVNQPTGREVNPDLADYENTIEKIADKRALVAATLIATAFSDMFTQDMEDAVVPATSESVAPIQIPATLVAVQTLATETAPPAPTPLTPVSPAVSPAFTISVLDHIRESIAIFKAREIPRPTFEEMVFTHLGVRKIEGEFTIAQAQGLRDAVLAWTRPNFDPIPDFDAQAFTTAVPDPNHREAYLAQIDPNVLSIDHLTPAQRSALRDIVFLKRAA